MFLKYVGDGLFLQTCTVVSVAITTLQNDSDIAIFLPYTEPFSDDWWFSLKQFNFRHQRSKYTKSCNEFRTIIAGWPRRQPEEARAHFLFSWASVRWFCPPLNGVNWYRKFKNILPKSINYIHTYNFKRGLGNNQCKTLFLHGPSTNMASLPQSEDPYSW